MKSPRLLSLLFCALILLIARPILAEGMWKIPNLLPVGKKKSKPAKPGGPSWSGLVKPVSHLVPDFSGSSSLQPAGFSPLEQVAAGTRKLHKGTKKIVGEGAKKITGDTKRFFDKTTEVLVPWNKQPSRETRRHTSRAGRRGEHRPKGGGSLLPFWSKQKKPSPASDLIPEFLSLKRVGFGS